jgi:chromosome segregation ATPase
MESEPNLLDFAGLENETEHINTDSDSNGHQKTIEDLKLQLSQQEATIQKDASEIHSLKQSVMELEARIETEKQAAVASVREELAQMQLTALNDAKAVDDLKQQLSISESAVETKSQQAATLIQELGLRDSNLQAREDELSALQKIVNDRDATIAALETFRQESILLKTQVEDLREQLSQKADMLITTEDQPKELKLERANSDGNLQQRIDEVESLKAQLRALEEGSSSDRSAVETQQHRIAEQDSKLQELEHTIVDLKQQLEQKNDGSRSNSDEELQALKEQLKTKDNEVASLKKQISDKDAAAGNTTDVVESLKRRLAQRVSASEIDTQTIEALSQEIMAKETALKTSKQTIDDLKKELVALREVSATANSDGDTGGLEALRQDAQSMKIQLMDKDAEIANYVQTIDGLKQQVAQRDATIVGMKDKFKSKCRIVIVINVNSDTRTVYCVEFVETLNDDNAKLVASKEAEFKTQLQSKDDEISSLQQTLQELERSVRETENVRWSCHNFFVYCHSHGNCP